MSQSMTLRRTRALLDHLHPLAPASAPLAAAGEQSPDVARRVTFSPDELRFFQNHGFLVVPGGVDGDACDTLRGEVLDICELDPGIGLTHAELLEGSSRDGDMLRQSAMHTEEQLLFTLRNSPALLRVASQVVDGQAMLYNGFTAVKGAGGGGLFDLHQDNMYTRHDNGDRTLPRTEGQNNDGYGSCGIWVALHDLPDVENGCLLVPTPPLLSPQLAPRLYPLLVATLAMVNLLGSGEQVAVDSHKHGTLAGEDYSSDRGTDKQVRLDWFLSFSNIKHLESVCSFSLVCDYRLKND